MSAVAADRAQRLRRRIDPTATQLIVCVLAALALGSGAGGMNLETLDFHAFYESARAWRTGMPLPVDAFPGMAPDLNPPTLSIVLAPLTWLPLTAAFGLFTGVSLLSFLLSLRAIHRRHPLSANAWTWVAIAAVGSMPFVMVWTCGQLTWLLLYPVTRAWLASTALGKGLWLSVAIAIKPPLALMAVALPWPIWIFAGAGAGAITGLAIAVTGWPLWAEWIALGSSVDWLGTPMNVSLAGVAARLQGLDVAGVALADLRTPALIAIGAIGCIAYVLVIRARDDRRWALALFWSLLMSPLGWAYYLPLALGPALASWPPRRAILVTGLTCLSVPVYLLLPLMRWSLAEWPPGFLLSSAVYSFGMLLLWMAWLSRPSSVEDF